MSDDDENLDEGGWDIVMPFVTVTSKGGPHDDESYVAAQKQPIPLCIDGSEYHRRQKRRNR